MKRRRTAILALTALAASGCGVGVHFAGYRHTVTPDDTHVAGPVSDIQVSSDSGHVTVTTGGEGVTVHRVVHYQSGAPHPGQRLSNGTLTFTKGCSRCAIDYDLTVPASVHVRASSDSGSVRVAGVAGADARSDSGSLTVEHVTGGVSAHTDSGRVTVDDVGGTLDVATSSGSVRASTLRSAIVRASSDSGSVRLDCAAVPGNLRTTSHAGSVHIGVPNGRYAIETRTDSGEKHIGDGLTNDAAAPAKLYVRTDSGGVTIDPL